MFYSVTGKQGQCTKSPHKRTKTFSDIPVILPILECTSFKINKAKEQTNFVGHLFSSRWCVCVCVCVCVRVIRYAWLCICVNESWCVCNWAASKQKPGMACTNPHLQAHLHVINFPPVHLLPQYAESSTGGQRALGNSHPFCSLSLTFPLSLPEETNNKNLQTQVTK